MKRLKDEIDSSDHSLAAAGRLIAQVAPFADSDVSAARVRRALEGKTRRGSRRRTGVIVAVVLGLAGSAAAAWGVNMWSSEARPQSPAESSEEGHPTGADGSSSAVEPKSVGAEPAMLEVHPGPVTRARNPAEEVEPEGKSAARGRVEIQLEGKEASPHPLSRSRKAASAENRGRSLSQKPQVDAAPTLSEARLVKDAVEALRGGGDPDRADQLLTEYRKKSSSGHLDEEALALSIEVALAKKSPDAERYARTYLQKYPGGQFTPLAQRALRSR